MSGYHAATVTRCDSKADFGICPYCGYSAAGEPFGVYPCRAVQRREANYLTVCRRSLRSVKSQEEDHSVRSMKKHLQLLMHHTGMQLQILLGKPSKGQ